MAFPALLLAFLASSAPEAPPERDIVVTGRAGPPFISPMGEPFRTPNGGVEAFSYWFGRADRNRDGFLDASEMLADADRFFVKLDTDHNGEIDPDELANYEWQIAPEIQVNNKLKRPRSQMPPEPPPESETDQPHVAKPKRERFRDQPYDPYALQGAARYALLNMPEPVAAADADFNRVVTRAEFRQAAAERFAILAGKQSVLGYQALAAMLPKLPKMGAKPKRRTDEVDQRIGTPLPPAP
jgi:hypothetical protein